MGLTRSRKKKLSLYFTDSVKKYTIVPDTQCNYGEKIKLNFTVINRETHLPLVNTDIYLSEGKPLLKGCRTDSTGYATIFMRKAESVYEVMVSMPGFWQKDVSFTIDGKKCQDVKLYLATDRNFYTNSGTVWEYKVSRHSKLKLKLKWDKRYKLKMKKIQQVTNDRKPS
jgi:hypothetical protein